jgi:ureidoacrylate peracid hydrolase
VKYNRSSTGLVVIDPYNDFISEGGKVWDRLKGVAEANGCVPHMSQVLEATRAARIQVFYALHHRYRPGDYENWKYIAPIQKAAWSRKTFEYGSWGGQLRSEFEPRPGDIVAQEHWCSSGFANTDLDLLLKRQGIQQLIMMGLIAHTCLDATVRFGAELGYEVTVVRDATASYSDEEMHGDQHSQLRDGNPFGARNRRRHLRVDRLTVNSLRAPRRIPVPRRRQLN